MVRRTGTWSGIVLCFLAATVIGAEEQDVPRPVATTKVVRTKPPSPTLATDAAPTVLLHLRLIAVDSDDMSPAVQTALEAAFSVNGMKVDGVSAASLTQEKRKQFLQVCQADRRTNTLTAPSLQLALGDRGQYRSGGEIMVPVANEKVEPTDKQPPLKTRFFGTAVDATVTQPKPGTLRVALEIEQSTLVQAGKAGGMPGISAHKMATTIDVPAGESALIRGVKEERQVASVSRVLILGELPVVGEALFTKREQKSFSSELLLLVTPELNNGPRP